MKPSAFRIERMLAKVEAALVPPPRKCLRVIIDDGDDEVAEAKKKEEALAELPRPCLERAGSCECRRRIHAIPTKIRRTKGFDADPQHSFPGRGQIEQFCSDAARPTRLG
jgi:hypothetical protein